MTALKSQKNNEMLYYKPSELIVFYKKMGYEPTVDVLTKVCIQYEYEAKEIKEICDEFKLGNITYRNLRNAIYEAINPITQAIMGDKKIADPLRIHVAMEHIYDLHFQHENYGNIIFGTPKPRRYVGDKNGMWQFAINKNDITEDFVAKILTVENLYIMVNTSKTFARVTEKVGNINALYLDIDNIDDVDGFIHKCISEGRFEKLEPSRINASGGGVHIYFNLKNCYANDKLNGYVKRIQKALNALYPEADDLSDLVRFLRLDGSIYRKENKPIKTVKQVYKSNKRYEIADIGPLLVPAYQPKVKFEKQEVYTFNKATNGQAQLRKVPGTWRDLEVKRLRDIEYLASIGHFDTDRRKRGIFFYSLFVLRASQSFSEASKLAYSMNNSLKFPLTTEEVEAQLASIKVNGYKYRYSRQKVVDQLEIDSAFLNPKQLEELKALFSDKVKLERFNKKRKLKREKKGPTERETKKKENYKTIKTLLQQGYKQKDIVETLNLSKGYVSKIVKQIMIDSQQESI